MPYLRIGGLPKREGVVLGCINDRLWRSPRPEPAELRWDLHARDESGAIGPCQLMSAHVNQALFAWACWDYALPWRAQLAEQPAARWLDAAADIVERAGVEMKGPAGS